LKKGHLSFDLHGKRLQGRWELVLMRTERKKENWLLIKASEDDSSTDAPPSVTDKFTTSVITGRSMDQIAEGAPKRKASRKAKAETDTDIKALTANYATVQLATLASEAPLGKEWLHEVKFDGYSLLGYLSNGTVKLRTRNGNDWTARFPSIATALVRIPASSAVLDMEAIAADDTGTSSFHALQSALSNGDPSPIAAYVFDLLHLKGKDLRSLRLLERKRQLERLLEKLPPRSIIHYSNHVIGDPRDLHDQACRNNLEGIISKRVDSSYHEGRNKTWLKVKCKNRQEFLIAGYSPAKAGNRPFGALYLGYWQGSALQYAGKVGTGFSLQDAHAIVNRLQALHRKRPVFNKEQAESLTRGEWSNIHWVKPSLVCEVAFAEWTPNGHIRHASFQGLREDKESRQVTREASKAPPRQKTGTPKTSQSTLDIRGVAITNPDRVISKVGDITKGELAEYYAAAASHILPQITRHPLSLLRCPSGIDGNQCFYQRSVARGFGDAVHAFDFRHKGKQHQYLYIEDETGLLSLIQMGTIELHPWGATVDAVDFADRIVFDLDPAPEVPFEAVKLAALDLKQRLVSYDLQSSVKCTGGKGLHVVVHLDGKSKWPEVKSFARSIAEKMVEAAPEAYVATMSKAKRANKIFIDYFRNDYTATAIADYCARAKPGAPVAMPIEWSELKRIPSSQHFTMESALRRLKRRKPRQIKGQALPS
jgi:bifunctional non-homologous end joining protein LigD